MFLATPVMRTVERMLQSSAKAVTTAVHFAVRSRFRLSFMLEQLSIVE